MVSKFRSLLQISRKLSYLFNLFQRSLISCCLSSSGITSEMLSNSPSTSSTIVKLRSFIGDRPIIAHNANFDLKFLAAETKRALPSSSSVRNQGGVCTLLLARRLLIANRLSKALTHFCHYFNLNLTQFHPKNSYKLSYLQKVIGYKKLKDHKNHRAFDDVLVTIHLWSHLRG
jgi:DNA polymerase III epsilon subunit-like protein